jgi:hypothetical protein
MVSNSKGSLQNVFAARAYGDGRRGNKLSIREAAGVAVF